MSGEPIRLTEWSRTKPRLSREGREALCDAAARWRTANKLRADPIKFEGPDGAMLATSQYVGVVCAGGETVEIYPKLDRHLLDERVVEHGTATVMHNLLWMLHVAERKSVYDAESASIRELPECFLDVFALLLARNLMLEMQRGLSRKYVGLEDDLRSLRGRLLLQQQLVRNWNRYDRIACAWDELTQDTPLFQLLKCACRTLQRLVRSSDARQLLSDCSFVLDDVSDVSVEAALAITQRMTWDRVTGRYRRCFDLARRLLTASSHALSSGDSDTFVFLIDMSELFQEYVQAIIEATFETTVDRQEDIGRLLNLSPGGIAQVADYIWRTDGSEWIGDAKYKHLASEQSDSLSFLKAVSTDDTPTRLAGRVLSPDDVRQLTVYGGLREKDGVLPRLAIFYPFVGTGDFVSHYAKTWNGTTLGLVPVKVTRRENLVSLLPSESFA